jgi:hypothetical protein
MELIALINAADPMTTLLAGLLVGFIFGVLVG